MLPFAVATGVQAAVALAAALAAAGALALPSSRGRRWAMPAALVLAALTVLAVASGQVGDQLSGRAGVAAVAAVTGLSGLALLGLAFRRWPGAFVVAAVAALPVRIPFTVGGETANLLLPLYAVIAGGVVAALLAGARGPGAGPAPAVPRLSVERVLAGVVVLYAVQALYSEDVEAAAKDIGFFLAPFAVLLRLLVDAPWSRGLVRAAVATVAGLALVFAGVGLYQFATRDLFLDNEKVLLANELKPYFRVNSLFFDPNIYGRCLALVMVLVAAALLWTRERRVVVLCAVVLGVLWAGLVPSLSESSFAALAVGLIVLAALRWRAAPVLAAAGVVVAAGVAVAIAAPGAIGLETSSFERFDKSTSGRAELVRGGLEMARDRPVGGFGSGSFAAVYRDREDLLSPRSPAESHTIPVTVAAEQGVIGLAAYGLLLFVALRLVLRGARRGPARAAVAAAFVALIVHTLLYAAFLEDPLAWSLLAAAVVLRRRDEPAGAAAEPAPAATEPVIARA